VMHFNIQRDPSDTGGVSAQAQALADLSDPDALTGLTQAEMAQIVNFSIAMARGTVGAAVLASYRATPLAGDLIREISPALRVTEATVTADAWSSTAGDVEGSGQDTGARGEAGGDNRPVGAAEIQPAVAAACERRCPQ
jgi:hypothetical protein